MSFFEESKRRNVFPVGIAYTVVAWILIQALSVCLSAFHAPARVLKVSGIAGFPVVLVAWASALILDYSSNLVTQGTLS